MKALPLCLLISNILFISGCNSSSEDDDGVDPVTTQEVSNTDNALDTDGDGLTDELETQLGLDPTMTDSDGDGVADGLDRFPDGQQCEAGTDAGTDTGTGTGTGTGTDPVDDGANIDTDGDGVADSEDRFPNDPTETVDVNNDGLGDNANPIFVDTDGDGLSDANELELGLDPTITDTDADGFSDSEDRFPNDPTANADSDNDGVPDSRDAFPNDATETADLNGDGLGDNANPIDGTVISGTVIDMVDGTGIVNAQVSLDLINSGNQNNAVVQAATDNNGSFALVAPNNLLPDSFVLVVTSEGYRPEIVIYNNNNESAISAEVQLVRDSNDFIAIEASPRVHHLGDDSFGGSANSQFQRSAEGISLVRNFNVNAQQAGSEQIMLRWVAKGIQLENTITINGQLLATSPATNADGSYNAQTISIPVAGILVEGSNTIIISSAEAIDPVGDFDDFEFVFVGLTGFN